MNVQDMSWSSEQYMKFENERNRPIRDLVSNIQKVKAHSVADIGCGPGNSTEILHKKYPDAAILGMDSSANMIEAACKRMPGVRFEVENISAWSDKGPFDIILANAVLQWVPDHSSLFPFLIGKLAPGGTLGVQMPDNLDEPAHRLMRKTAAEGPWAGKFSGKSPREPRRSPEWYYELLMNKVASVDIWRTTYYHVLKGGASAIVEWFKGTGLRPFLDPLNEKEKADFLAEYEEEISKAYPVYTDGTVLLPFPRLFLIMTK